MIAVYEHSSAAELEQYRYQSVPGTTVSRLKNLLRRLVGLVRQTPAVKQQPGDYSTVLQEIREDLRGSSLVEELVLSRRSESVLLDRG